MRGKLRNKGPNRRDHRDRRQERSGNYKFVRRGGGGNSFRNKRRNFDNRRRQFKRNVQKRGKLSLEKLNEDLDNYYERKGGDGLKDHLDNELEVYKKNAKMNENLKKETISLPVQQIEEKKNEEENVEMKVDNVEKQKEEEVQVKEVSKEEPKVEPKEEVIVEEKKEEKKKKKRGKK